MFKHQIINTGYEGQSYDGDLRVDDFVLARDLDFEGNVNAIDNDTMQVRGFCLCVLFAGPAEEQGSQPYGATGVEDRSTVIRSAKGCTGYKATNSNAEPTQADWRPTCGEDACMRLVVGPPCERCQDAVDESRTPAPVLLQSIETEHKKYDLVDDEDINNRPSQKRAVDAKK
jgi:hypothetical protein